MKKILLNIYFSLKIYIPYFFTECKIRLSNKKVILINAFLNYFYGHFHTNNWGDDLNVFMIEELTGKRVVSYQASWISKICKAKNYMCIGSFLHACSAKTIVWGSGVLSTASEYEIKRKPLKVLAVRGPLSRKYLLAKGIDCPEVYGDPALLLPLIHMPKIEKKYRVGIVPHMVDFDSPEIKKFENENRGDILIIDLVNYNSWHDIIDQICACDIVLSSSLHGLIVSDAYNVPNVWVEFPNRMKRDHFKYLDYFNSVKRNICTPIDISTILNLDSVIKAGSVWTKPTIDLMPLIEACPFPHEKLKNAYN